MDEFGDGDVEFGEGNADVTADEGSTEFFICQNHLTIVTEIYISGVFELPAAGIS